MHAQAMVGCSLGGLSLISGLFPFSVTLQEFCCHGLAIPRRFQTRAPWLIDDMGPQALDAISFLGSFHHFPLTPYLVDRIPCGFLQEKIQIESPCLTRLSLE